MALIFDPEKDRANVAKHGISLARASELEVVVAFVDSRRDYGEVRKIAYGLIDGSYYSLAYALRDDGVRPISLRRAHEKEIRRHVR
jgi:uncharacterized DUF497 family protein